MGELLVPYQIETKTNSAADPLTHLLSQWIASDRTPDAQRRLLEPYRRKLMVGLLDGSGLSQLTSILPLFEVQHYVDHLKREFYRAGRAIGGLARGKRWVADNGAMFLEPTPETANAAVFQMVGLLKENQGYPMGMAITLGRVEGYLMGDELYGHEVEQLDNIGEDVTPGRQLYLTDEFAQLVTDKRLRQLFSSVPVSAHLVAVDYDRTNWITTYTRLQEEIGEYPLPFSRSFGRFIATYPESSQGRGETMRRRYISDYAVVFIVAHHTHHPFFHDELLAYQNVDKLLHQELPTGILRVKLDGLLGIFAAKNPELAVAFAKQAATHLSDSALVSTIGIAYGEIALFRLLPEGRGKVTEIAGSGVNNSSKWAEDWALEFQKTHPRVAGSLIVADDSVGDAVHSFDGKTVEYHPFAEFTLRGRLIEMKS